jgi:hypothetical protein
MNRLLIVLVALLSFSPAALTQTPPAPADAALEAELVAHTQAMLDAVVPGDQAPWRKYIADDAVLTIDDGRTLSKAQLLAEFTPLPPGYSGDIKLENPQMRRAGDAVVLTYDLFEHETVFGQAMTQRYHQTDTWAKRGGEWQIVGSEAMRLLSDPAEGKVDPARLPDYAGTYVLSPTVSYVVTVEHGALYAQRTGRKQERLLPETPDVFFRQGALGYKYFERDAAGKVTRIIDRSNGRDLIWTRQ